MPVLEADNRTGQGIKQSVYDRNWISIKATGVIVDEILDTILSGTYGFIDIRNCSQILLAINYTKGNLTGVWVLPYFSDTIQFTTSTTNNYRLSLFVVTANSSVLGALASGFYMTTSRKLVVSVPNPGMNYVRFYAQKNGADNTGSDLVVKVLRSGFRTKPIQV